MNTEKVFAKLLKAKANKKDVTLITDYVNAKEILKYALCMPDTYIVDVKISDPEWENYDSAYSITFGIDGDIYCQPTIYEDGKIARGGGLCYIDANAIIGYKPDDFVLPGESEIKLIGG